MQRKNENCMTLLGKIWNFDIKYVIISISYTEEK